MSDGLAMVPALENNQLQHQPIGCGSWRGALTELLLTALSVLMHSVLVCKISPPFFPVVGPFFLMPHRRDQHLIGAERASPPPPAAPATQKRPKRTSLRGDPCTPHEATPPPCALALCLSLGFVKISASCLRRNSFRLWIVTNPF